MTKGKYILLAAIVILSGFAGGLSAGLVFRAQPAVAGDEATIEKDMSAKQLNIVDKDGNLRLLLSTDDDGSPAIAMYDKDGKARSVFTVSAAGDTVITFNDGNGKLRVAMGVTGEGGPEILMKSKSGAKSFSAP